MMHLQGYIPDALKPYLMQSNYIFSLSFEPNDVLNQSNPRGTATLTGVFLFSLKRRIKAELSLADRFILQRSSPPQNGLPETRTQIPRK